MKFRSRGKLVAYKKANEQGTAFKKQILDSRFEHHNGTRIVNLYKGRKSIVSHGWVDYNYVHLWNVEKSEK